MKRSRQDRLVLDSGAGETVDFLVLRKSASAAPPGLGGKWAFLPGAYETVDFLDGNFLIVFQC